MKRILFTAIAGFWVLMMGLHLRREFFQTSAVQSAYQVFALDLESREEYTSVMMGKEQIGFNFTLLETKKDTPETPYELRHQTYLSFLFLGQPREMLIRGTAQLDKNLKMRAFETRISSSDYWTQITGKTEKEKLELKIQSNEGDPVYRTIPLPQDVFFSETLRFLWTPDNLVAGKKGSIQTWNPLLSNFQTVQFQVKGKTTLDYLGKNIEAYEIHLDSGGIATKAWVSQEGVTLKEESATGFTTVKKEGWQIFDVMRTQKTTPPDLPNLFSIPANIKFKNPESLKSMTVKIRNQDQEETRTVLKDNLSGAGDISLPVPVTEELKIFLEPTPEIQTQDPAISEKAKAIIDGSHSALEAAQKLLTWTHENIAPVPSLSIPNARQVLGVRKGDCNEYTVLYTALARSIGIPARMNAGLVYHEGRFFYHAWPEIYLGRWIAVDPTFGQMPADATHIALQQGPLEEQVKLVTQLGKINILIQNTEN